MGGKGGMKKQRSPKGGAKVITIVPGKAEGTATGRQPKGVKKAAAAGSASSASSSANTSPSFAAFEPLGDEDASDYSEGEEEEQTASSAAPAPMALDATTTAALKKTLKQQAAKRPGGTQPTPKDAGVLYLGHIPHGFYDEQMRDFFSQFGTVSRLRLARNKKTGRSKHYAFIEFKQREVADVVAKAMNGYLLFSKILVAKVVSPSDLHPETFKGANRPFKIVDRTAIARKEHNKPRTAEKAAQREAALLKGERAKRAKLAKAGIDYEFAGYEAEAAKPRKRTRGVIVTTGDAKAEEAKPEAKPAVKGATAEGAAKQGKGKAAPAEEEDQPPPKKAKKAPAAKAPEAAPSEAAAPPAKKTRKAEEEAPAPAPAKKAPAKAPAKKAPAKKAPK